MFHVIDTKPIQGQDLPAPAFDPPNDVFFMLFTRSNPTVGQRIARNAMDILNSNFNPSLDVRVLIHGWVGSHTTAENVRTTAEFLTRQDYNVIGKYSLEIL